jgi:hypothetical protein
MPSQVFFDQVDKFRFDGPMDIGSFTAFWARPRNLDAAAEAGGNEILAGRA